MITKFGSGDGVPGSCIATHMGKLRKKANELGLKPQPTATKVIQPTSTNAKIVSRPAAAKNTSKPTSMKRKRGAADSDEDEGGK